MTSLAPPSPPPRSQAIDPVLRNTLRYTVSAREYAVLHRYLLSRSRLLRRSAPSPASVEKALQPRRSDTGGASGAPDDYNARAVRHALRLFAATWLAMKGWDAVSRRIRAAGSSPQRSRALRPAAATKQPWLASPAFRLSLSLSSFLLLYRLLFRFWFRLRTQLLDDQVEPFRRRNPRIAASLTSPYAPAVGASLAGLTLGVYPASQLRVSIAIYMMCRALEFSWNFCEAEGLVWGLRNGKKVERPWWFGSWMLQPFAFGQLLDACVSDSDCFPEAYGNFIFKNSSAYLHERPPEWPRHIPWPKRQEVVDSLAEMARLGWPPYISPTLFPDKQVLPPSLQVVSPLTCQAHPLIDSLACATTHPSEPSCFRTYLTFWLNSFPPLTRFFLLFFSGLTLASRFRALYHAPSATLSRVVTHALRMSTFVTGAISTAWASICFFQNYLPRRALANQRFFLGGFAAGLWAWLERRGGRGVFLYSARASVDSLWKVGVKRRWWRAVKGVDVGLLVLSLMLTGVVYEREARAIRERQWRKGLSWVRGEGWRDWAAVDDEFQDGEEDEPARYDKMD